MSARRPIAFLLGAAMVATACGAPVRRSVLSQQAAHDRAELNTPPTTTTAPVPPAAPCTTTDDTARSFRPQGPLPPPGQMPARTFMQKIQARGKLIVGVDQNTIGFGYRDAKGGDIAGFDTDLLREIAAAIFGSRDAIEFLAVTSAERIPAVKKGSVDIVASIMSITCERWRQVDFSTEYYAARQRVLVRAHSPIHHVADLNGKRVCATKGSTSIDQIHTFAPGAKLDAVDLRTECLVHLQEGLADAISTDDTILYGFEAQDPNTTLLPDDLNQPERYGMAIRKDHPEFVRFVNAVLEQVRADGRWTKFHRKLEHDLHIPATAPPAPLYRNGP